MVEMAQGSETRGSLKNEEASSRPSRLDCMPLSRDMQRASATSLPATVALARRYPM